MASACEWSSTSCQDCSLENASGKHALYLRNVRIQQVALCLKGGVEARDSVIGTVDALNSIYLENCIVESISLRISKNTIAKITLYKTIMTACLGIFAEDRDNPVRFELHDPDQDRHILVTLHEGNVYSESLYGDTTFLESAPDADALDPSSSAAADQALSSSQ